MVEEETVDVISDRMNKANEFLSGKKVVLLFTPGLDTFLTTVYLKTYCPTINYDKVYFNLSSKYSRNELDFISVVYGRFYDCISDSINISKIESESAYVPNRNILLATMAQGMYDADVVLISGFKDDRVSDNNMEVMDKLSVLLSMTSGKEVTVGSMFWDFEKSQILSHAIQTGKTNIREATSKTYSCYDARNNRGCIECTKVVNGEITKPKLYIDGCRTCKACFRKFSALAACDLYIPFHDMKMAEDTLASIDQKEHPYRYESVVKYINYLKGNI